MTTIALAQLVLDTKTCHVFRRSLRPGVQWDAKPYFTGSKRGWIMLDLFTASAIVAVAKSLNPTNRARLDKMHPVNAAHVCLRLTNPTIH